MNKKGFTLVEMLVVIAILATLCGLLYPAFSAARAAASRKEGEVSEPHETVWLRTVKHDGHLHGCYAVLLPHPCHERHRKRDMERVSERHVPQAWLYG